MNLAPVMPQVDAIAALHELLALTQRSFPQYLRHARPYRHGDDEEVLTTLDEIVADQDLLVEKIIGQLERSGHIPPSAEFPMEFTGLHDLALDYLLDRAIDYQKRDLAALELLSESLACHQTIRSLVDEATGMARGHLQSLEECCANS